MQQMKSMEITPDLSENQWRKVKDVASIVDSCNGILLFDEKEGTFKHLCLVAIPADKINLTFDQYIKLFVAQVIDKVGDLMATYEIKRKVGLPMSLWRSYEVLRRFEGVLHNSRPVVRMYKRRQGVTYG